jgi:hypothetical protein
MTSTKAPYSQPKSVSVNQKPHETDSQTLARTLLEPHVRHGALSAAFASKSLGENDGLTDLNDIVRFFEDATERAEGGDLKLASRLLASQALTLDSIFTELTRRSAANLGEYPTAAERYMRLALKAQTNCRTTLDALGRLHQPREQTVKHVHVNDGGQAVVADQFHHHGLGGSDAKLEEQSHATEATSQSPTLLGEDPQGHALPIASSARKEKV